MALWGDLYTVSEYDDEPTDYVSLAVILLVFIALAIVGVVSA